MLDYFTEIFIKCYNHEVDEVEVILNITRAMLLNEI